MSKSRGRTRQKYLPGTPPEGVQGNTKWGAEQWGGVGSAVQGLLPLLDLIGSGGYSREPFIDASTAYTMNNPYRAALGGTMEDLSDEEGQQLEQMAQQYGVDVATMLDMVNQQYYQQQQQQGGQEGAEEMLNTEGADEGEEFATGGTAKGKKKKHWIQGAINPKHKGYCTPMTKSTCTGRRRALAKTFKKHHGFHKKKALGGEVYANGGTTDKVPRSDATSIARTKLVNGKPVPVSGAAFNYQDALLDIGKLADPTGITNYGDLYNAWATGTNEEKLMETLASLPMVGKVGKAIRGLENVVRSTRTGIPILKAGRIIGSTASAAKDISQDYPKIKTYASGGRVPIEVEGGEIMQQPGQAPQQITGPSHESGGVDRTVPKGTKIYSDRLMIDGKTMADRKMAREKQFKKLSRAFEKNSSSLPLRNTVERQMQQIQREEQQDMAIQNNAKQVLEPPIQRPPMMRLGGNCFKCGGKVYAYGSDVDDEWDKYGPGGGVGYNIPRTGAWWEGYQQPMEEDPFDYRKDAPSWASNFADTTPEMGANYPPYNKGTMPGMSIDSSGRVLNPSGNPMTPMPYGANTFIDYNAGKSGEKPKDPNGYRLTAGDYTGMAGTLFSGLSGLATANAAARNTQPVRNRWLGAGHDAIQTNQAAQRMVGSRLGEIIRQLDSSYNTSMEASRGSSPTINTLRAMQAMSGYESDKAKSTATAQAYQQMANLMGQEGQLYNWRDERVASGAERADERIQQNLDNYFSSKAQALQGLGEGVQTIGRDINTGYSNMKNNRMLAQLSEWGLTFDRNGNLVQTDPDKANAVTATK